MFGPLAGGEFSPALLNIALLALWMVPATLSLAYGRQSRLVRRLRPEFSLHKSEAAELDRALILYRKVCGRLNEIKEQTQRSNGLWRIYFAVQADAHRPEADEHADLEAHANHLCATIVRLRRLPLGRLRSWTHAVSLRLALGRALAIHIAAFGLLLVALHISGQTALAQALPGAAAGPLTWFSSDQGLVQANAGAACFAAIAIPAFYLRRRRALRREFALQFCVLKELAAMPPGQVVDRVVPEIGAAGAPRPAAQGSSDWFTVLGVPQSAGIAQVREAYRALIKQNHPDRVQGLSPAIKQFAETEAKRINAAYHDALAALA